MSIALNQPIGPARTTRLTALVSGEEAASIARKAEASGLSVSAYLRERALETQAGPETEEESALRQVDQLIARMQADIDGAVAALDEAFSRMSR